MDSAVPEDGFPGGEEAVSEDIAAIPEDMAIEGNAEVTEEEGFVNTVHGKGSFVAFANQGLLLEEKKKEVEADLEKAIRKGRSCGLTDSEIRTLFEIILED